MKQRLIILSVIIGILLAAGGIWYVLDQQRYIFTDKAEVYAPLIQLTPRTPGILKEVLVKEGDPLRAHEAVARVGNEIIHAEVPGVAVQVEQNIGASYAPGQAPVTMIEPKELRIMARVEEDKGLTDIHVGQQVKFTLDAYGGREFAGTVESVSPVNRSTDVVFNISDKREKKEYDIKIAYDQSAMPTFQSGMSARVWIIK